jgi:hypothetical protein
MVKFKVSQPGFVEPISAFGKKMLGQYKNSTSPDEILSILNQSIIIDAVIKDSCTRNELDIDSVLLIDINSDNALIEYLKKDGSDVKIVNDSIFYQKAIKDTMFIISKLQVLKKYKGQYYLNYQLDDGLWTLKIIYQKQDTLYIDHFRPVSDSGKSTFTSDDEAEVADSTIETEPVLNPDKKELKQLLKSNRIENSGKYVKILSKIKERNMLLKE